MTATAEPAAPFADLTSFAIDPETVQLLDEDFCRRYDVALVGPVPESLRESVRLGMLDPADEGVLAVVKQRIRRQVEPVQLAHHHGR